MKILDEVAAALDALGTPFALIGGQAVIARGYVRATLDYDFLSTDRRILEVTTWQSLSARGVAVDCRSGAFDDPIAGVTRLRFPGHMQADVLLAKWKWEASVIDRADIVAIDGRSIRLPRTADLILLKIAAGGIMDLQDATILLRHAGRDGLITEVESRLGDLDRDAQAAWARVKADSALPR